MARVKSSFLKSPRAKLSTHHKTGSHKLGPHELGYRMPAEWEPHAATWLAWPHEKTDWPGKFAPIPWVYADIVRHLSRVERVRILVQDAVAERAAVRVLKSA